MHMHTSIQLLQTLKSMAISGSVVGAVLMLVLHPVVAMLIVVVIFLIDCVMLGWIPALGMQLHRCELFACVSILFQLHNFCCSFKHV